MIEYTSAVTEPLIDPLDTTSSTIAAVLATAPAFD